MYQYGQAMDLAFAFVAAMVVAGGLGYLLDRLLHTGPWLMIAFGVIGFGIGLRDLIRRVTKPRTSPKNGNNATRP